jgi:hypothetical protein
MRPSFKFTAIAETMKKTHITTFDGKKYPIESIENIDSSLMKSRNRSDDSISVCQIIKFPIPRDYRIVTIGDSKVLGKNDEIYIKWVRLWTIVEQ